nr:hypothetical protein [Pantoea stewartii]
MFRPGDLAARPARSHTRLRGYYLQGLGLHHTNPKAALTRFTVTSVGLTRGPHSGRAMFWLLSAR